MTRLPASRGTCKRNILAIALNTGGGKWIGHRPIFQIFATSPTLRKYKTNLHAIQKRHTEKESKAKVKNESVSVKERNIVAKTIASDLRNL